MMKKLAGLTILLFLALSCEQETEKNALLEAQFDGQIRSFKATAVKYTDFVSGQKTAYDYHINSSGTISLSIEAYDATLSKVIFNYPDFEVKYIVELPGGTSKTYEAVSGQFRIIGENHGNFRGDFYFKVKNISDATDSVMIANGYFDIYLNKEDRTFP